jgi:transcriptional regulator with XRE-family HTH domain
LGSLAIEIGLALRRVREERGLTLRDVATLSEGVFKATSVAGYERGERSISVERFLLLCQLYGVPANRVIDDVASTGQRPPEIDLRALESLASPESSLLAGFIREVVALRSQRTSETFMLRSGDLAVLATASGSDPEELMETLRPAIRGED